MDLLLETSHFGTQLEQSWNKQWHFFPARTNQLFTVAALRATKTHFIPLCINNSTKNAKSMEVSILYLVTLLSFLKIVKYFLEYLNPTED